MASFCRVSFFYFYFLFRPWNRFHTPSIDDRINFFLFHIKNIAATPVHTRPSFSAQPNNTFNGARLVYHSLIYLPTIPMTLRIRAHAMPCLHPESHRQDRMISAPQIRPSSPSTVAALLAIHRS